MIALILAAGVGARLGAFTADHPKCLLPIGESTLLQRMLASLAASGVDRAVLTVGHCADQVRAAVAAHSPLPVSFADNPDYLEGSVLSLWYARTFLGDDDTLLMDADVLYPQILLDRLIRSQSPSCALLDGRVEGTGEEMILCAGGGRVWDIVRRRPGQKLSPRPGAEAYEQFGESVGFFKLGAAAGATLAEIVDRHVAGGGRGDEYEALFPELFARCEVGYERVDDLPWTEIDFPEDAERARRQTLPAIEALKAGAA